MSSDFVLIDHFATNYWIEKIPKGLEIHIHVPLEYWSLWLTKFDELKISYREACRLLEQAPFYVDQMDEEIDMIVEYVDEYWSDKHSSEAEFHIRIPQNYEKLWTTKLAALTATDEEIEEYRDDVGSM
jgi:hypothetical protein